MQNSSNALVIILTVLVIEKSIYETSTTLDHHLFYWGSRQYISKYTNLYRVQNAEKIFESSQSLDQTSFPSSQLRLLEDIFYHMVVHEIFKLQFFKITRIIFEKQNRYELFSTVIDVLLLRPVRSFRE